MQHALVRGHRWLAMLESGEVQSLTEIAKREGVCSSYVSRMVELTVMGRNCCDRGLWSGKPTG